MDKLEKARLIKQWENAVNKLRDRIDELDPNMFSYEEITLAIHELPKVIEQMKNFWREKLDGKL